MGLSFFKGVVLFSILVLGGARGHRFDTQNPIVKFRGNDTSTCHDAVSVKYSLLLSLEREDRN